MYILFLLFAPVCILGCFVAPMKERLGGALKYFMLLATGLIALVGIIVVII